MYYALRTPKRLDPVPAAPGEVVRVEPRDLLGGVDRFLDADGELRLLFPGVLPAAAPFLLFRLKRQGFSRCRAEATRQGLYLTARR